MHRMLHRCNAPATSHGALIHGREHVPNCRFVRAAAPEGETRLSVGNSEKERRDAAQRWLFTETWPKFNSPSRFSGGCPVHGSVCLILLERWECWLSGIVMNLLFKVLDCQNRRHEDQRKYPRIDKLVLAIPKTQVHGNSGSFESSWNKSVSSMETWSSDLSRSAASSRIRRAGAAQKNNLRSAVHFLRVQLNIVPVGMRRRHAHTRELCV